MLGSLFTKLADSPKFIKYMLLIGATEKYYVYSSF